MSEYSELDDADLMSQVCNGNHLAYTELVHRHTDKFYALAFRTLHNKSDAEDVLQSALVKLWIKPQLWDSNKSLFTTWFYRVVLNSCHDYRKKNRLTNEFNEPFKFEDDNIAQSDYKSYEEHQYEYYQSQCLEAAISKLSEKQKNVINLLIYSQLPQKQAAEILGIKLKALESLFVRAKKALHDSIIEQTRNRNDRR